MSQSSVTTLDPKTCLELMATQALGRLIFTHRALPDVLPVTYRLENRSVLIRLAFGSVAAVATRGSVVAFETDDFDIHSHTGWSVTIVGRAHELTDSAELRSTQALDLRSWGADQRDLYFRVAAEKISGHRLDVASEPVAIRVDSDVRGPHRSGGAAA